ncbi:MAG: cysteine desulfurase [Myxococcales bacterium]|nr:cysteine desulfurase [Myxococcales bacterium]
MALIYLDNQSTTRCDPRVLQAMLPWFSEHYGNAAARSHALGMRARGAIERARAQIARWVGASPKEVILTSGATEANNLAVLGVARAALRTTTAGRPPPHVVTVATEHPAVLDPVEALRREGVDVTVLGVDADGLVDPDDVQRALRPTTVLVSVMRVNNEIGVVQPLHAIVERCRAQGVAVHTDAAQASLVPVDMSALDVDLVSVSAHKIYGPKGVGALVVRRRRPRIALEPLLHGGGHERGLRSGTLPVPLVVGLGEAAQLLTEAQEREAASVVLLRDQLLAGLREQVGGIRVNGSLQHRAPNNLNVSFDGVEAAALLVALRDIVCLSTGSACSSESQRPSHVLDALGMPGDRIGRSVRFGLGRFTTEHDITTTLDAIAQKVGQLRSMASLYET